MKHLILTISLILGTTAVSAETKVGEILGTGKVINQFDQPSKRNGKLILIHKIYVDYQTVSGCIIAQEKDQNLEYALTRTNDVEFLRYELNFRLTNES